MDQLVAIHQREHKDAQYFDIRRKRIAQILEGCQSLLQYYNFVQMSRWVFFKNPRVVERSHFRRTMGFLHCASEMAPLPRPLIFQGMGARRLNLKNQVNQKNRSNPHVK